MPKAKDNQNRHSAQAPLEGVIVLDGAERIAVMKRRLAELRAQLDDANKRIDDAFAAYNRGDGDEAMLAALRGA